MFDRTPSVEPDKTALGPSRLYRRTVAASDKSKGLLTLFWLPR
jgi:hypothetical protein